MPSGLSSSLATLARNFDDAMPTVAVSPPVTSCTRRAELLADLGHRGDVEVGQAGGGEVDEGLVERQRLDQRGELAQHLHDPLARVAVGVEAPAEERGVRTAGARLAARHRRADAVAPGLVRRGGHHAPPAGAADDDGLAAQRGLVALLDGGEEGVQVEVEDRRGRTHAAHPRSPPMSSTGATRAGVRPQGSADAQACGVGGRGKRRRHGPHTPHTRTRPDRPRLPPGCGHAPPTTSPPSCPLVPRLRAAAVGGDARRRLAAAA